MKTWTPLLVLAWLATPARGENSLLDVAERIERAQSTYLRQHPDAPRLEIATERAHFAAPELLDPATAIPRYHEVSLTTLSVIRSYEKNCDPDSRTLLDDQTDSSLAKALRFADAKCQSTVLPAAFFQAPPYMHPSGVSYVRLAHPDRTATPPELLRYLHATEHPTSPLAHLSRTALLGVLSNEPAVRDRDQIYLLAPTSSDSALGAVYRRYSYAAFRQSVPDMHVELTTRTPALACVAGTAHFCWVSVPSPYVQLVRRYIWVLPVGVLLLLALWIAQRWREREHKLHVIRTLAHELRTPATSLALSLEALRSDFDLLPETSQNAFLRMCDDVQRLTRMIQGSSRYLKVDSATPARLDPRTLPSLREFLNSALDPYQNKVEVDLADHRLDRPFRTDPYWLGVSITNLVENALRHGATPVKVRATIATRGKLEVAVSDAGAFGAQKSSPGLGLGLSIVARAMQDLGGRLDRSFGPTTFTLRLKEFR